MSRAKTIAVVGVSDAEVAHLRLLMRRSADDLEQSWRWGDESGADLIVVDPGSFAGQMARTRAQGSGVRYAVFADEPVADADLVLHRPLLRSNVIEVLNRAGGAAARAPDVGANAADFYTRDLGDEAPGVAARADAPEPAAGLDEALRPLPLELREASPQRTAAPAPVARGASAPGEPPAAGARTYATRAAMLADTTPHGLRAFLEEDLLRMPARFALPDAPALVLDPKNKVAHAAGNLAALAPYCHAHWRLCDWQPLTGTELAQLRETQSAHAYARLVWLDVLLHSGGQLARHLDPGGTYRLKRWIEIDQGFNRYFRIASVMLQPARLHEIAAASGAPMADVFDVVNACDAIGLLEWQARPPREAVRAVAPTLLQRLRKPFGKS